MSDGNHARGKGVVIPDETARAAREADLARQHAEILAENARRRKVRIIIAVGVVVAAGLVWLGVEIVRRALARVEVRAELAKIRARGEPLVPVMVDPPQIPDDENAAILLVDAYERFEEAERANGKPFESWELSKSARRIGNKPVTDQVRADLLVKAISTHEDIIRSVRVALERPGFNVGAWDSPGTRRRIASREIAKLLSASALVAARQGRRDEALADIALALGIANRLFDVPNISASLNARKTDMRALEDLTEVAAARGMFGEGLSATIQALGGLDLSNVLGSSALYNQAREASWASSCLEDCLTPPSVLRERAEGLRIAAEMVAACRLPPWEALAEVRAIAPTGQDQELVFYWVLRSLAARDVARVGLALELYRSAKGEYPAKLDALAPEFLPELPPDPYTGKPLRYLRGEKGFVVYSVGEDLFDAGGRSDPLRPELLDIPWTGGESSEAADE